jgi:hypothetical protein
VTASRPGTQPGPGTPRPGTPPPRTVLQGGRAKAYRPLPMEARAAAARKGLEAYERGDFFEAHELLEPAWMGSADPAERELVQGLIKLTAAFVHAARGNPLGIDKNLRGAQARLAEHLRLDRSGPLPEPLAALDVARLLAAIEALLREPLTEAAEAPSLPRV